ncbi:glycoside hydrolase family 3 C-terminal domain-containing protein [Ruminococcus sp. 5_1_39BFAA]|uniref:glycoside hydrolase family 3 C-terminal domain-containing protein n=1 Tax=Ruminococcus sp. 5_1_39BFAA TaxID=457412 RepID=UPI00356B4593
MDFEKRARELVGKMTLAEKTAQMKYDAPAIERLHVPAYNWWNECLHGVARAGRATVFPQAIGMAASFNTELMFETAQAISDEARANYNEYKKFGETDIYQGLTYWAPNINIFRDPRWGRGHETYGEDPYLTGRMGVSFIKGLQGDGKYRKLDATVKHYAVHSGPESERHSFNAVVEKKDLYETYLWAFQYCIENADPSAVMGAYNRVNGEPCCASAYLLGDVLRGEFGFKGYVVSDCGAVCDINQHHHVTENEAESAALAVNNGCDLNCGTAYKWLKTAVAMGLLKEEIITEAVVKLFTARFRLGMFDDDCEYDKIPYSVVECEKHMELNRKMARESIVLLKNNGILPLGKDKKIAVIGPNADSKNILLGNYNGTPSKYYTILRGVQEYAETVYAKGCHLFDDKANVNSLGTSEKEALIALNHADVVILCMGLDPSLEGEEGDGYNSDAGGDRLDLELPPSQKKLYHTVIKSGKPVIFVNVSGSCVNLSDQKKECDAVIQCFYPGAMGGLALADILFGEVSPSGRLPVTFYENTDDLPDFHDYSMKNRTYKFYKGEPVFAFGHGLTYADILENWIDDNTVEVTNKGNMDTDYSVLKFEHIPHKKLCGLKKVFIRNGETVRIKFDSEQ